MLCEQVRTIDKQRLGNYIGHLKKSQMMEVNHTLAVRFGLDEPFSKKVTLCLCDACADDFRGTGVFHLRRVDPRHAEKKACAFCGKKHEGVEYEVTPVYGGTRQ